MWSLLFITLGFATVCIDQNTICNTGYYQSDYNSVSGMYTCCECPVNCLSCISNDICLECEERYGIFSNGTVATCEGCSDEHCLVCGERQTDEGMIETCFTCAEGFVKDEDNLCTYEDDAGFELIMIMTFVIMFVGLIYIIAATFVYMLKKYSTLMNNSEESQPLNE
ncbi:CXXC-rich protein [Entamoeba marina]